MGTNYYVAVPACDHCGHAPENLHIGKSSGGWTFALNTHPQLGLNTLKDWRRYWRGRVIVDEYGDRVTMDEMTRVVRERSAPPREFPEEYLSRNYAIPGPNGLLRHKVDGRFCVGHGRGTWDLMRGDFS